MPDGLGELVSRHGASLRVRTGLWISLLLLPASIVVFPRGLAREWNDNIIAISFLVAIIALVAISQLWRMGRRWTEIREHGFVLGRGPTPLQSVRWTDIVSVGKDQTQQYINGIKTRLTVTGWAATPTGRRSPSGTSCRTSPP